MDEYPKCVGGKMEINKVGANTTGQSSSINVAHSLLLDQENMRKT